MIDLINKLTGPEVNRIRLGGRAKQKAERKKEGAGSH